jgi:hypothetical protein
MADAPSIIEFAGLPPERHTPVGGPLGISDMTAALTDAANEYRQVAKQLQGILTSMQTMLDAAAKLFHLQQRHLETSLAMRCGYAEAQHGPDDTLPAHIVGGD